MPDTEASASYPSIFTVNSGSSSIKFAIFDCENLECALTGSIERVGFANGVLKVKRGLETHGISLPFICRDQDQAVERLLGYLDKESDLKSVVGIGHRVVTGGSIYKDPLIVTSEVLDRLESLQALDAGHLPAEIKMIKAFKRRFSAIPHIACFDTTFHQNLPRVAQILPIPRRYWQQGVRRFGFHGLSYQFMNEELKKISAPEAQPKRVIFAHLGNGASLAAVRDGQSVDTTMSLTPASGLPMGTRSGDLDPGLFSYLSCLEELDEKRFFDMVSFRSGLLGVSETSSDMENLLAIESQDERAADAVAMFCYEVKKWIGAYAAVLGGLDCLVFAGGIGENSAIIRARVCEGLEFLGIQTDEQKNNRREEIISSDGAGVLVRVMHTDEEKMMACAVRRLITVHDVETKPTSKKVRSPNNERKLG